MAHVKRILITCDPQEVRVAVVEGGKLVEAYIERRGRRSIVGNIYLGKVDAVLPGMEAAFVDIGLEKNGFLYVNEIVHPDLTERERRKKGIQELLKAGQEVLVQVTKDPMGTKGARLTMEVSLAGRFMVLTPDGEGGIGVSKRLSDDERTRLRDLIKSVQTVEGAGLIVRTAAAGASADELERDVRLLERLWEVTKGHAERSAGTAPALVYTEPDLSLQTIRDDFRSDVSEVVVDDERQYHRIHAYVQRTSPELVDRVKLYRGKRPLFQRFEIDAGIRSTLRRRADLPSGGYLIFDYGEAFTVIDVNTGRYTGAKKLEDTILKTNLEATIEVVRQLRLRDIGGIIVVDFIDMSSGRNRDKVLETLQAELQKDRSKVYVVDVSPLGLIEMTRKNIADGVREILTRQCDECEGTGRVLSEESIAIEATRTIRRHVRESKAEAFRVELNAEIAARVIGPGGAGVRELELESGRMFAIDGIEGVKSEHVEIVQEGTREELAQAGMPVADAAELTVELVEPAPHSEVDALARLEDGYAVVVAGAAPYVGTKQRIRVERAMRTAAYAVLLDAEPAEPMPDAEQLDPSTDILEPERQVTERVDVEGRVRRQKKAADNERRRDERSSSKRTRSGSTAAAGKSTSKPAGTRSTTKATVAKTEAGAREDGEERDGEAGESAEAAARRRRRRRGGRGRRRPGTATASAAANGAEASGPERAPEPVAPPVGETAGAKDGDAPARPRRRRGGRGRGGSRTTTSGNGSASEPAPANGNAAAATSAPTPRPPRPAPDAPAPVATPRVAAELEPSSAAGGRRKRGLIGRLLGKDE